MIAALLAASVLTLTAVDASAPDDGAVIFGTGDVLCVGYDAADQTCLTKTTISRADAGGAVSLEQMRLKDFGSVLQLSTLMTNRLEGRQYCLEADTIRAVVVPEIHPSAPPLIVETVRGWNSYARAGYCVEHRQCGAQAVALASFGGDRFADEDLLYTLFRADDLAIPALTVRPSSIRELGAIKGFAPVTCLP